MSDDENLLFVFSNAVEGRDRELNDWYLREHHPEILQIPGMVDAQRYRLDEPAWPTQQEALWRYLSVYRTAGTTADLLSAARTVKEAGGLGGLSTALAPGSAAWMYTPLR